MTNFTKFLFSLICLVSVATAAQAQVFFSEDFEGGAIPADWMAMEVQGNAMPFSNWVYTTVGPEGPFSTGPLESTSSDNGWVMFDSDSNCNLGAGQEAWLITPAIVCSDKEVVILQYENLWRVFNDRAQIRVGTDLNDLANWATYDPYGTLSNNDWGNGGTTAEHPHTVLLDISDDAALTSDVYVAFQFLSDATTQQAGDFGCAYSWQLDDISLTDVDPTPPNDLTFLNFAAIAPNLITPLSQADPIHFLNDIQNVGAADQNNVEMTVTVTDAGGTVVFDDLLAYETIESDSFGVLQAFDNSFFPSTTGTFDVVYEVTSDESAGAASPDNNLAGYTFMVSDSTFAKEEEFNGSGSLIPLYPNNPDAWVNDPTVPHQWGVGNFYYATSDEFVRTVTFSIDGTSGNAGEVLEIRLYKWTDDNADFFVQEDARESAGVTFYEIVGNENLGSFVTIPFINITSGSQVQLEPGSLYLVMIEHPTEAVDDSKQVLMGGSNARDYFPMVVASIDFFQDPRWAGCTAVNSTPSGLAEEDYDPRLYTLQPVVRMSVGEEFPVNSVNDILDGANATKVFPTPASEFVTLDMDFTEVMDEVTIQVTDNTGRILSTNVLQNVKDQQFDYNVSNLATGTYFFQVITPAGTRIETFVVAN